jgi:hypothetical protein
MQLLFAYLRLYEHVLNVRNCVHPRQNLVGYKPDVVSARDEFRK